MPGVTYLLPQIEAVASHRVSDTVKGTKVVHGKKIFRSGTFKDSRGVVRTWTNDDLDTIAANYNALKDSGSLMGVPLRVDHTFSARDVVGWISECHRDGNFLIGDLHFTEPEAYEKWNRGTFGPVSSEIAPFETNAGDLHYPTLIGVAFVDIPAVDSLFRASGVEQERVTAVPVDGEVLDAPSPTVYERGQEVHMTTRGKNEAATFGSDLASLSTADLVAGAANHQNPLPPGENPNGSGEPEGELGGQSQEAQAAQGGTPAAATPAPPAPQGTPNEQAGAQPAAPAEGQPPAQNPAPAEGEQQPNGQAPAEGTGDGGQGTGSGGGQQADHGNPAAGLATFRVNGVPVNDMAAVQRHIETLEQFRSETIDSTRREFVKGLVSANKINAAQADALTDLALSMDATQYAKFTESYAAAPVSPLMASYGSSAGHPGHEQAPASAVDELRSQYETARGIVEMHTHAGKPKEWIEQTDSFKRMTELKTQLPG